LEIKKTGCQLLTADFEGRDGEIELTTFPTESGRANRAALHPACLSINPVYQLDKEL